MGLFGFGKKDYAKEFKDAFESTDVKKCIKVTQEWQKSNQHDRNCSNAVVILSLFSDSIDPKEVKSLYDSAKRRPVENQELAGWYDLTARLMLKRRGIDVEI